MANAGMLVEWGMPIEGRESKSLEVFMAIQGYVAELKAAGRVEDYRTCGLHTGNHTARTGFMIIETSAENLVAIQNDETWRRNIIKAISVCHNLQVNLYETGDEMIARMQRYGSVVKDVLG